MKTVAIDTEYDYKQPFLATVTDEQLKTRVFKLKVLSDKRKFKKICEDRSVRKVFHNITSDMFALRCIGIQVVPPYEDTMIVSNLVDENFSSRNLKKLVEAHIGEEHAEADRLRFYIKKYREKARREGRPFKWSDIPDDVMIPYAKRDPEDTIKLWYYWKIPLHDYIDLYKFEKSLIPIIAEMQRVGVRIHRKLCLMRSLEYKREAKKLYNEMADYVKTLGIEEFNPNSIKQIQFIISKLGLDTEINPKTGVPKADKDTLLGLASQNKFFALLNSYRFYKKHNSTYYEPLYNYYTSRYDDRAHFGIYQTGAKSGRFSMELAQTFPRPESKSGLKHEVRKVVIPGEGRVLLCKDYEQQEMRLFAHYSNCTRMIDIINAKGGYGVDCYLETAELPEVFGDLMKNEKYREPLRWVMKQDLLGMIYGIGTWKLIKQTTHLMLDRFDKEVIDELGIDAVWANHVLLKVKDLYPIEEFMRSKISELYRQGYVRLEFNSPLMKFKRDYRVPRDKAYKAVNIIIQGTAAYIIKHAMLRIDKRLRKEGLQDKIKMILQVHDELIFEVDENLDLKKVNEILSEEMEDHVTFKIPITTSAKFSSKSWGDVRKL